MALARPFRRLLIANRGEIAVRIARAARSAGIAPLGIASDADTGALHVSVMDDVASVGPGEAARSYLDVDRVIAAARTLGADAVHPGYGFLSERAPFARACAEAGLVFVGPSAEAIEAMGDKAEAKRRARARGVPVVPGYDGDDQSLRRLREEADSIGLPLLVKATAGGGGRGMRVVREAAEFEEALASARREALAAFGDDRVLLERYVERSRHVEIQIVADTFGAVRTYGERECSIQRRHQKVVEEAPAPGLADAVRERMLAAAIEVARSVDYTNAGTVEFLLDAAGGFFFLEMNARLQVEHPVTELVYDVDLVQVQFAIASGERLDATAPATRPAGAAIEARIVAEDAEGRPATGTIERWTPPQGEGLRLDSGVAAGSEVGIFYDSLLAKLVAWGPDRRVALDRLRHALGAFDVTGISTNLPQLRAIAEDAAFARGETTTAFLTERAEALATGGAAASSEVFLLAAAALATSERTWRIGGTGVPIDLRSDLRRVRGTLSAADRGFRLDGDVNADFTLERSGDRFALAYETPEGARRIAGSVTIDLPPGGAPTLLVRTSGSTVRLRLPAPPARRAAASAAGTAGAIVAPMPGRIARVAVRAGAVVAERELLVVLEAMKMEHRIVAPAAGTVRAVRVREGAIVSAGAPLVEIE